MFTLTQDDVEPVSYNKMRAELAQVLFRFDSEVTPSKVDYQMWNQVSEQVLDQVLDQVVDQVDQVVYQVDKVLDQVSDQVLDQLKNKNI